MDLMDKKEEQRSASSTHTMTTPTPPSHYVQVRRFLRPEDISKDHAYKSDWADVYAQPSLSTTVGVDVDDVEGQCSVVLKSKNRGMSA